MTKTNTCIPILTDDDHGLKNDFTTSRLIYRSIRYFSSIQIAMSGFSIQEFTSLRPLRNLRADLLSHEVKLSRFATIWLFSAEICLFVALWTFPSIWYLDLSNQIDSSSYGSYISSLCSCQPQGTAALSFSATWGESSQWTATSTVQSGSPASISNHSDPWMSLKSVRDTVHTIDIPGTHETVAKPMHRISTGSKQ